VTPLERRLHERIRAIGPLRLDAFIESALGDSEHGYYTTHDPVGARGDFVTAPEICQVFGELIGLWLVAVWEQIGAPRGLALIELGPGRGTLLADALRAIAQVRPSFRAAVRLHLVERSPVLRRTQAAALARVAPAVVPEWHETLATVPAGPFLLLANEFFDVLPIRQFVATPEGWRERYVAIGDDGLTFVLAPAELADLPAAAAAAGPGEVVESCRPAEDLAAEIGARGAADGGAALIVDYGPSRSGPGDSLQAVHGHGPADVLARPGEVDLSHHVDFEALARAAAAAAGRCWGPIPQGLLLGRLGAAERAAALAQAAPDKADAIQGAVRRLVHPGRMGLLFKALAVGAPTADPPPGFEPAPN
jgi:NADH dehydrogenase [ubiquinone] 1 alpha subcomplex assembly factor 7